MYWLHNTETNTPAICGSVIAVSQVTGISENTIYTAFSRKKLLEYEYGEWRICRVPVIRSTKTSKIANGEK
jgi:hypothetical protein